jgi:glucan phosphoethanolaminetransferase (alkaline phosphatase superfamily)
MNVPEEFKFKLAGFSGARSGYVLATASLLLFPIHSYVDCDTSGAIFVVSICVFFITLGLSLITPQSNPHRFRPVGFALFAIAANMLATH